MMMSNALIVVDVQNDFVTGTLAVPGSEDLAERISNLIATDQYDHVLATMDWHIDPGEHWSDTPDFKDSWPKHCEARTWGAELAEPLREADFDQVFYKGRYSAEYSGFDGIAIQGHGGADIFDYYMWYGITHIDIVGLALDHCVRMTALDAIELPITPEVRVLTQYTRAVDPIAGANTLEELASAGIIIKNH